MFDRLEDLLRRYEEILLGIDKLQPPSLYRFPVILVEDLQQASGYSVPFLHLQNRDYILRGVELGEEVDDLIRVLHYRHAVLRPEKSLYSVLVNG